MTALPADVALLVIDLQPDFMPGGTLACEQGDALVAPITALLAERRYRTVVATQDWHPADHASFASQHPGGISAGRLPGPASSCACRRCGRARPVHGFRPGPLPTPRCTRR